MTMGKRLQSLRQNLNMTLKETSANLGVSLNSVYRWEHDLATPRREALNKLAAIYQVPIKWLLYGVTVEEGSTVPTVNEDVEQSLLRICRKLPENSRYKILGYAERVWVETMKEENIAMLRPIGN